MTKQYEPHPYADIFPMPDYKSVGFKALVEDIKANGQQEPITLYQGKILDGRTRAQACLLLGIEVITREYLGSDPIGFVLSTNLHRRHLNEGQRAMVAGKLADLDVGANQHSKEKGTSIDAASKLLNVGRASIDRARKVLASGDPSLIEAVEQGKVSVSAAANQAAAKTDKKAKKKKSKKNVSDRIDKLVEHLLEALTDLETKSGADTVIATIVPIIRQLEERKDELEQEEDLEQEEEAAA